MESRQHPRVSVMPPGRARFQLGGKDYEAIRIVNVGINGCCILAPTPFLDLLGERPILEGWRLLCPGLPADPIQARVIWVGRQGVPRGSDLKAGVQFLDTPSGFTHRLFRYVTMRFRPPSAGAF